MDLFELLIIAAFVLFPIIEGVLKQRRKGEGQGPRPGQDPRRADRSAGRTDPRADQAPRSAADMLPDDLWELMTGERRQRDQLEPEGAPWSTTPGEGGRTATDVPSESRADREVPPWGVEEEARPAEPVSLEYQGPEAYSLETPAPEPRSLEQPIPSPEVRHRAFHQKIDRPRIRSPVRTSPLIRALSTPGGLRQAVLAREILGPPKGLE